MKLIYLAGPLFTNTTNDWQQRANIIKAFDAEKTILVESGGELVCYCPHYTWYIDSGDKHRDLWLKKDEFLVQKSDAVLRLEGESKGADLEVEAAQKLSKPVFYSIDELFEHFKIKRRGEKEKNE